MPYTPLKAILTMIEKSSRTVVCNGKICSRHIRPTDSPAGPNGGEMGAERTPLLVIEFHLCRIALFLCPPSVLVRAAKDGSVYVEDDGRLGIKSVLPECSAVLYDADLS